MTKVLVLILGYCCLVNSPEANEYRDIDVKETLGFASGPIRGMRHPNPASGLRLNNPGTPWVDVGCLDSFLSVGATNFTRYNFNVQEGDAPVLFFQDEVARLGGGLHSYYSYVTSRNSDGTPKSGGMFAEFTIERDITFSMACPLGFICEKTESYDVSYADTRVGADYDGIKLVTTQLSFDGTCVDGEGNIQQCPLEQSCTEVWQQSGQTISAPITPPSTLEIVRGFLKSILRSDSEGDVQPRTKTAAIGVRG